MKEKIFFQHQQRHTQDKLQKRPNTWLQKKATQEAFEWAGAVKKYNFTDKPTDQRTDGLSSV